jgi:hypothetical protein
MESFVKSKFIKTFSGKLSIIAASVFLGANAGAATKPASIATLSKKAPVTLNVKSKGWSDPAFGNAGWTHFSGWGQFTAKKGQRVEITVESSDVNVHPGITVWFRGANDTAPDSYVPDHFYQQASDFIALRAKDETTSEVLGNIVMKHVANGYDKDDNPFDSAGLIGEEAKGLRDGVPGKLKLTFRAKKTGKYQFVTGGVNPSPVDIVSDMNTNIPVTVTLKIRKQAKQ